MMRDTGNYFDIARIVVLLVAVDVMYLFSWQKTSPDLLLRYDPVLVRIPAHISKMVVFPYEDEDITV
jgi:hypothetical protein